eukprot:TRINITY_DN5347_c0_g1_i1.p1 TRINITY_DN5347_c0_g1~~TRINITY_DN5347_c0_g1_i1.p1  ORF type:complete len:120 (-),score=2.76 TRINITY_DN5347_c0_g1_i1:522-881(-)
MISTNLLLLLVLNFVFIALGSPLVDRQSADNSIEESSGATSLKNTQVRLCGIQLNRAIRMACQAVYRFKRSYDLLPADGSSGLNQALYQMQSRVTKRSTGASDHCCRRSCSLSTLSSFC